MVILTVLNNKEFERFETIDWCSVAAGREGEPLAFLVIFPLFKNDLPEPDHHFASGSEAIGVDAVVTQLFEVQLSLATNQCLHLLVIEEALHDAHIEHPLEALPERGELPFALLYKLKVYVESNELVRTDLSDLNRGAARFELSL